MRRTGKGKGKGKHAGAATGTAGSDPVLPGGGQAAAQFDSTIPRGIVPNWKCATCGNAGNFGSRVRCRQCGAAPPAATAKRQQEARRSQGQPQPAKPKEAAAEIAQLRVELAEV